jgi:hypothetical protein
MDELILQLKALTEQLISEIDHVNDEQITEFIESREMIISNMKQSESVLVYTQEQKELLRKVMDLDPIIINKIIWLKDQASEGLIKISKIRLQKDSYDPVYAADSMFFDKKK